MEKNCNCIFIFPIFEKSCNQFPKYVINLFQKLLHCHCQFMKQKNFCKVQDFITHVFFQKREIKTFAQQLWYEICIHILWSLQAFPIYSFSNNFETFFRAFVAPFSDIDWVLVQFFFVQEKKLCLLFLWQERNFIQVVGPK